MPSASNALMIGPAGACRRTDGIACAGRHCARLGESRAPTSLGEGKRRGAKGVGPSHREQGNGQQGKGFGTKTITYRTADETADEGERD
jgi:hypothetical protein